MKKSIPLIILMVAIIVTVVSSISFGLLRDKTGPVITVGSTTITYKEGEDVEILLAGVSAYDAKDGDVSDTLLVESLIPIENEGKVRVIYAACDKKNNVSKASKIIKYIPLPKEKNEGETDE